MECSVHILMISLTWFFLRCYGQDQVRMTILNAKPFDSEANNSPYQCRTSDLETNPSDLNVESLRTGWTRETAGENPDPPQAEKLSSTYPYYKVVMTNNGNNDAFGVFGCNATKGGKKETIISTIRMRRYADIVPSNGLFTQTVSIEDPNVTITMESPNGQTPVSSFRWRNNTELWDGLTPGIDPNFGVATFRIDEPVQLYHAGIYECHKSEDRASAKHGLNLLIVRACPHTRWDPPACEGVCDSCYNGGVCDEYTGKCICAPGFDGENCLTACGGNRYGYDCEQQCTYNGDPKGKCGGFLFCLVHPFGCRCNTGFRGLDCNTACEENTFGASCLQSCHCVSDQCYRYTGECEGTDTSCDPGWTGEFCQECVNGYFGSECDQECHCSSDKCNRDSGLCQRGGCLPQWADLFPPYSCQTGLESATYTRVNQNVTVPVNCTAVQGPGGNLTDLEFVLSRSGDELDENNIALNDTFLLDTTVTRFFTVGGLDEDVILYCQLRNQSDVVAVLTVNVSLYELPKLKTAPREEKTTNTSVTISWSAWDEDTDVGDPPLIGYITYYKDENDDNWIIGTDVSENETLEYTFIDLVSDTNYLFSVAAVREGEGGEGSKSPTLEVKTICAVPDGPQNVITNVAGEEQQLVEISWEHPSSDNIRCRGGVMMFKIYYSSTSPSSDDEIVEQISNPALTSFIIYGLEVGEEYVFEMTLTTEGGESRRSNAAHHLLPVLPELSFPPEFADSTSNSVTVRWAAWDETSDKGTPPVVSYNVYHKLSDVKQWSDPIPYDAMDGKDEYSAIVEDLIPDTLYDFSVAAVREGYGGEGLQSPSLEEQKTICDVPITGPQDVVTNSAGEKQELVNISWKLPPDNQIRCSEGVVQFYIYYSSTSVSSNDESIVEVTDPSATSYIIEGLERGEEYIFEMTLLTEGGESGRSDHVQYLVPGPNVGAIVGSTVGSSLLIVLVIVLTIFWMRRKGKSKTKNQKEEYPGAINKAYSAEPGNSSTSSKNLPENDEDAVYANVERPVPILLKDFENFIQTAKLEQQFLIFNSEPEFPTDVGAKEANKKKNRFKNMIAYDHSRVVLPEIPDDPHSDYYNANFIKNSKGEVGFIAAQGPNKASVEDFWRMVWMENVSSIVMLTNLIENGKDRCFCYWPSSVGETIAFGMMKVAWQSSDQYANFEIRQYLITVEDKTHTVRNWHYKTWPDKDIPDQPSALIEFAKRVKIDKKHATTPLLVHCSAGVGRTGTFIALCSLMDVVETSEKIDVFGFVAQMREDRVNMVQTAKQFKFLHDCLLEVYLAGDTSVPVEKLTTLDVISEGAKVGKEFKLLAKLDRMSQRASSKAANEPEKCRYPDIIPVEKKRPYLQSQGKNSSSNYINACFVMSYRKEKSFIATQSPLPSTIEDFWRLVYDWGCPLIVMLNQLDEGDETVCKYWPDAGSSQYGHITVELKEERKESRYTSRLFQVDHAHNQKPISVHHLQLNSWDENNLWDIYSFIKDIEKLQQDFMMVEPTVIHCINGVGRTGIIIAVKSEMERIEAEKKVDVFTTVRQMRASNHNLVKTKEEYALCHQLLKLSSPESTYANI
ncbi:Receptor-type tyrosine-protein phosphatase alpha [Holothuria leucospilota]|uniref:protein-tyrosine-phosphatase n=1 Tax=Holothuria leucospilota TaxID=206669 RepID=A0A9Q1HBP1_HOLLE|nr:Receptor-type tyrosine-protein phosphatase alpha [Holothuria leucospilota]